MLFSIQVCKALQRLFLDFDRLCIISLLPQQDISKLADSLLRLSILKLLS